MFTSPEAGTEIDTNATYTISVRLVGGLSLVATPTVTGPTMAEKECHKKGTAKYNIENVRAGKKFQIKFGEVQRLAPPGVAPYWYTLIWYPVNYKYLESMSE